MAAHASPPLLRDGDHLTSEEFLRRWEAMPDLKHAELIDGIVYLPSPVSRKHSRLHFPLSGWLAQYATATPGCEGGIEATWLMGNKNVPQPDLALLIDPGCGGQAAVKGEYFAGAPELIVEIAVSSRARDLGEKLTLYERMGVREYVVAVAAESKLVWNELTATGFQPIAPDRDGIFRSRCFPGLWLDANALWPIDLPQIAAVLQQGINTQEHTDFVTHLSQKKTP